ncbi:MAG: S8 family serine peptidase [Candidatus Bathyarchaeota archaeon]|nr:MAG: S8 family serine peptidase [Candidatus Bathyarchaeota archaeon]
MKPKLKVNIAPNEILFPDSRITVEVDTPLNIEFAQGGISVRDLKGKVQLSNGDRTARWEPSNSMPPGHHTLIVRELVTKKGERISDATEIPFFVTDSAAKIPAELRIENLVRFKVNSLGVMRIPSDSRISGEFLEIMKASNRETGAPIELAFNEKGDRIDSKKIFAAIAKNRLEKFGKIHESLHSSIEKAGTDTPIKVAVWIKSEELEQEPFKNMKEQPMKAPVEVVKHHERVSKELAVFSKRIGQLARPKSIHLDPLAPVVYAELNKDQIREIEKMPEVLAVFLHETDGIDDLKDSIEVANSDDVHDLGYKGSEIKVAVWENGPDQTTDLVIEAFYDTSQANTSDHARHTHCIVKNKEKNTPNGHAPSCKLHSANDKNLSALRWAVRDKRCTIISQSFHRSSEPSSSGLSFDDVYKDWLVLNWPYPTMLQAAGNYWNGDPDNIIPPSNEYVNHKGYNSLAVGNHNDDANAMSGSSVFRNPASDHGDRELPEICANGIAVTACGLTKSGTSMAAPAVAGITAAMQEASSTLKYWPEGCRAILLAGAKRNVNRDTWWKDVIADVDASDGTGAVDAHESIKIVQSRRSRDAIASRRGWDVGTLRNSDFNSNGFSTFSYKVQVPLGHWGPRHVKIALAWNSKVRVFNFLGITIPLTSRLATDFDLRIYDSSGNLVSYSLSWDNSYEIAEFFGTPGETYTIRIHRWSGTHESWYGIAWTVTGGLRLAELFSRNEMLLERALGVQRISTARENDYELKTENLLEHVANLKTAAQLRGQKFESLSKKELLLKMKRKTSKSPFFFWHSWGSTTPGGTITYNVGIHNPDPVSYSGVWLFAYLLFGPANFISDSDKALLSIDNRFPSYAKDISVSAGGSASVTFSIDVPANTKPGIYIGNCFLVKRNSFDVGDYLDRAAFDVEVK